MLVQTVSVAPAYFTYGMKDFSFRLDENAVRISNAVFIFMNTDKLINITFVHTHCWVVLSSVCGVQFM